MKKITGDYKTAYFEALVFLNVSDLIHEKSNVRSNKKTLFGLRFAEYVNHAFAVELLIKCILLKENGYHGNEHNLQLLFSQLKQESQDAINLIFTNSNLSRIGDESEIPITVNLLLKETPSPFMSFRYNHETGKNNKPSYHLDVLASVLKIYLLKKYKELRRIKA